MDGKCLLLVCKALSLTWPAVTGIYVFVYYLPNVFIYLLPSIAVFVSVYYLPNVFIYLLL